MADGAPTSRTSSVPAAFFLACSWTWVVGMWLPVILVRHFGWPGWVAFAVPNVVGAMSVGLVYRTREQSEAFVARRLRAMRGFSKVTLALHAFVLMWAFMNALDWAGVHPLVVLLGVASLWAIAGLLARSSFQTACMAAAAVWALSVVLIGFAWATNPSSTAPQTTGDARAIDLLFIAPVLVFGFALCPYLDLTIHRARQETPGTPGSLAFVLSFGGLFLAMIAGTLLYAQGWLDDRALSVYVVAHFAAQSWFTVAMHLRSLKDTAPAGSRRVTLTPLLVGVALGLAPWSDFAASLVESTPFARLLSFDAVYRSFMAFYGLLFPALLWTWSASKRDDRRATLAALFCVGLAAPMFWMGFLEGRWFWLAPGVLIALLSPLLARAMPAPQRRVSARP